MKDKKCLSSNVLKLIAIIAMTIDHLLWVIYPGYNNPIWVVLLHIIGRITAPIMCYFISIGYSYTHDVKKYALRLFIFAIISHFAYTFAFGINFIPFSTGEIFNQTSVMWSLFLGLISIIIYDSKINKYLKVLLIALVCALAFPSDWSMIAVLIILHNHIHHNEIKEVFRGTMFYTSFYALVYMIFIDFKYGLIQMGVIFSIPLLNLYNGKRGNFKQMKWLFYVYYPLHLVICGIIRIILHGNISAMIG